MFQQFLVHITQNDLCRRDQFILLAVSGGVDSMVMLNLFLQAGIRVGVAHCNFRLRPGEADEEERMVTDYCRVLGIPCHVEHFDTARYAEEKKLSPQVAARNLRYAFFEQVRVTHGYDLVATAHHLNDNLETVLLNLVRGTGIDGLTGIPARNNHVIRPLLFASRLEIESYAREQNLPWREDSSNKGNDYHRNLLRNEVIPTLKTINPALEEVFANTLMRIKGSQELAGETIRKFLGDYFVQDGTTMRVLKEGLKQCRSREVLLWECIKGYGFSFEQSRAICREHQSGSEFESRTHILLVDRSEYIIIEREPRPLTDRLIRFEEEEVTSGGVTLFLRYEERIGFRMTKHPAVAHLDLEKIKFPLRWRNWCEGDFFSPLGMRQRKKISDFLIDEKIPLTAKQTVTVLESGGEIVWVVGMRISDKAKITEGTTDILTVEVMTNPPGGADKTQH